MSNWKGGSAGYPDQPSADRNKKASVDFDCPKNSGKQVPWKGKPSVDGAKPSERKAAINPGTIHDIKSDRKTVVGPAPGGKK